jgi:hypothetical protein
MFMLLFFGKIVNKFKRSDFSMTNMRMFSDNVQHFSLTCVVVHKNIRRLIGAFRFVVYNS